MVEGMLAVTSAVLFMNAYLASAASVEDTVTRVSCEHPAKA